MNQPNPLPHIFVSIASYRDPECQHTIRDLLLKAAYPQRIRVGVCWQFDPAMDQDCFEYPAPFPAQVRELRYYATESKGAGWARAEALSLVRDEEYTLLIDSHMRFVPAWDVMMIDTLKRCPSQKAVLSTMTFAYTPPDQYQDAAGCITSTYARAMGGRGGDMQPLHLGGYMRKAPTSGPILNAFMNAGVFFAPTRTIKEVPIDPHIYFWGDELTYSARLWTHGWDMYQPDQPVIYHYWGSKSRSQNSASDYKKVADARAQLARQRVWHVLGLKTAQNPAALVEIEKYGMGSVRSLEEYWKFAGVDLQAGIIEEKAKQGLWTPFYQQTSPQLKKGKVFGVGLPRTGTTSISVAMLELGYKTCHFCLDYGVFDRADALFDTPIWANYESLDKRYPGSKFILTWRNDAAKWYASFASHVIDYSKQCIAMRATHKDFEIPAQCFERFFGKDNQCFSQEFLISKYYQHRKEVEKYFRNRPNDLLIIDITTATDPWGELCQFLDCPRPTTAFPKVNLANKRFDWDTIRHSNKITYMDNRLLDWTQYQLKQGTPPEEILGVLLKQKLTLQDIREGMGDKFPENSPKLKNIDPWKL